jgi:hypothetical protein
LRLLNEYLYLSRNSADNCLLKGENEFLLLFLAESLVDVGSVGWRGKEEKKKTSQHDKCFGSSVFYAFADHAMI